MIRRQDDLDAFARGLGEQFAGELELVVFDARAADGDALSLEKRVRHRAADQDRIDLGQQISDQPDLVGDFCAAQDRDRRVLRILGDRAQRLEFAHHQESGRALRDEARDADGRGVRAMCGAEAVVHIDLFVARQFMREVAIVGFLFFVEAQIFEQNRFARLERLDHFAGVIADAVGRERDLLPEHLR